MLGRCGGCELIYDQVVERTIAWLTISRQLAKDYERLLETGEMLLYLAMSRILLRRLMRKERSLLTSLLNTNKLLIYATV
ncbi:transposase [Microvirga aerilata]|uniref:transposase n=1 Tax=Microvirga aerilata TaxID=670292 RepID=UPI0028AE067B|nr:transposase [Microvirga aerilata]